MYFKFQNLIKPQATVQTRSIPTHECTMRLAPGHKFTPGVKKKNASVSQICDTEYHLHCAQCIIWFYL